MSEIYHSISYLSTNEFALIFVSCDLANQWVELYNVIRDRKPCQTSQGKQAKYEGVKSKALAFLRSVLGNGGDNPLLSADKITPYLHVLVHHLPEQIRALPIGIDIMDMSGSGIEAINKETKQARR